MSFLDAFQIIKIYTCSAILSLLNLLFYSNGYSKK